MKVYLAEWFSSRNSGVSGVASTRELALEMIARSHNVLPSSLSFRSCLQMEVVDYNGSVVGAVFEYEIYGDNK